MANPDPKCGFFGDPECYCRKHKCECPFDFRPLTDEELKRTLALAELYNWQSE